MPVADIELAGFYMHKDRWLEQLAIVEKRRGELAEELQEILAEESIARLAIWWAAAGRYQSRFSPAVDSRRWSVWASAFPIQLAIGNSSHWPPNIRLSQRCWNIAPCKRP